MHHDFYPAGTVQQLLQTDLITPQTQQILRQRLEHKKVTAPRFLEADTFAVLQAVCNRLVPQTGNPGEVDLPGHFEEQLIKNEGDGWRYDALPPDATMYVQGLTGINQTALLKYRQSFPGLTGEQQDEVLLSVQQGKADGEVWQHLKSPLFFEELLASVVQSYYCHPIGKNEIGEVSMADAQGWTNIRLDEKETFEPAPIRTGKI